MPRGRFVPSAASQVTTGASVVGSTNRPVWFGLTPTAATACVRFFGSGGSTGGASEIISITASPFQTVGPLGPFISACGIYVTGPSGTGASACVWLQP